MPTQSSLTARQRRIGAGLLAYRRLAEVGAASEADALDSLDRAASAEARLQARTRPGGDTSEMSEPMRGAGDARDAKTDFVNP